MLAYCGHSTPFHIIVVDHVPTLLQTFVIYDVDGISGILPDSITKSSIGGLLFPPSFLEFLFLLEAQSFMQVLQWLNFLF